MKILFYLLQKEFRQIFRNKTILVLIMVLPVIQLLIIPLAADYEIKNINLSIVDHDHSTYAQKLISKITASGYFRLHSYDPSYAEALKGIYCCQRHQWHKGWIGGRLSGRYYQPVQPGHSGGMGSATDQQYNADH